MKHRIPISQRTGAISGLESYQRGLQQLITSGKVNADDSAYLQDLVDSSRLAVVREIVCFWRAQTLERFCVITSGLLKRMGRFDRDIERFVASGNFSPFIEEAGMQFLRFLATDTDSIVAALANTEIALHATRTDLDKEMIVEWPCNPEPILAAIIEQNDLAPEWMTACRYRLKVSRSLPAGYVCEPEG